MEILFFAAVFTRSLVMFNQRLVNLLQIQGNHSVTIVNIPYANESWTFDLGGANRIDIINEKVLALDKEKTLVDTIINFFLLVKNNFHHFV